MKTGQLKVSKKTLEKIGFKKVAHPKSGLNSKKTTYEIDCINGVFYYNVNEHNYRWYQKITVGGSSNYINLNINTYMELFLILSAFNVKYKLAID
jgi:hypothetical protein